jgi:ElaB/YqjD/DUF883 family membrane-anchored ribosome-binding protein
MTQKTDCESDIKDLRKQMEELASQQSAQQKSEDHSAGESEPAVKDKVANSQSSQLREKIEEFVDLMEQDLKQVPVTTAVAIFGLGVLFGRLMPR